MNRLSIESGNLIDVVEVPSSKSYANRMLILGALKGNLIINNLPSSTDVTHLIDALKQLNIKISNSDDNLIIESSFLQSETRPKEIFVGEGGTTARFLAGMLSLSSLPYALILGEKLKTRPWSEFIDFINQYGGKASLSGNKLVIQGPLKLPSVVKMDCTRTTQFATAIQMAYPDVKVEPVNMDSSVSYWQMTQKLLAECKSINTYSIPLDWSSASYAMSFAALKQEISFPGLFEDEFQSDSKLLRILKELDAVEVTTQGLKVRPLKNPKSLTIDVSDCLDLVPSLGFLLSHIPGTHKLLNVANLVHKESDRLNEVIKLLKEFGKMASVENDTLTITGSDCKILKKMDLVLPDDHRMVMVGALFLRLHAGGSLGPAEAVDKSYPQFFKLFK